MTEVERLAKSRAYHRAYAEANRERIRANKRRWRADLAGRILDGIKPQSMTTLKIKTENGGWRRDQSNSWESKLTTKKKRRDPFVPAEQLYREITAGYHYFWSKRRTLPETLFK